MGVKGAIHLKGGLEGWKEANGPVVMPLTDGTLSSCRGHGNWRRDFRGASGVFSFLMDPCSQQDLRTFVDGLDMFGIGLSWRGYESLILPADVSAARTAPPWREAGQLIRLSIGLEHPKALIADLAAGFARLDQQ